MRMQLLLLLLLLLLLILVAFIHRPLLSYITLFSLSLSQPFGRRRLFVRVFVRIYTYTRCLCLCKPTQVAPLLHYFKFHFSPA